MLKLSASKLKSAEFARNIWRVHPEHGTTQEDVCRPDYWAHVAAKLHVGDIIEVIPEDQSFFAELYVQYTAKISAKVFPLRIVNLQAKSGVEVDEEDYEVKWRGPRKFSIVRKEDGSILEENIDSREEADAKLSGYLRKMAA